jgi:hypothetical protein
MIATICSSVNRALRIAPSESGASFSTYRRSENPGAGQMVSPSSLKNRVPHAYWQNNTELCYMKRRLVGKPNPHNLLRENTMTELDEVVRALGGDSAKGSRSGLLHSFRAAELVEPTDA